MTEVVIIFDFSSVHGLYIHYFLLFMCSQIEGTTTQGSTNQDTTSNKKVQEPVNDQDKQPNMELSRTDSRIEEALSSGIQTPQYDAFLQSLSNDISSYLSALPQQFYPALAGDPHQDPVKAIKSRPEKPSRIERKRPKRTKRTKP